MEKSLRTKLSRIKLLATDVDGVLTDGGLYYSENGDELKRFNVRDGMGLVLLRTAGFRIAIITSEDTRIVERRAIKLRISDVVQGTRDKVGAMEKLLRRHGLSWEEAAYIGDDVNDTELLKRVGFSATPANGVPENRKVVDYITKADGGGGCVREICDMLLSSRSTGR